jgi:hypothetical protein
MRAAAQTFLAPFKNFTSIDGTAEHTTLPASSFDLVVAGQAFHWFDRHKAREEFRRILHLPAWTALIWNERDAAASPFQAGYEHLVQTYASDYAEVDHRCITPDLIADFFGGSESSGRFHRFTHRNDQLLTPNQIRGRWLSSSYAPAPGHPQHDEALAALNTLITTHQQAPTLSFAYQTKLYVGQLH